MTDATAPSEYAGKPVRRLLQTVVLLVLFLAAAVGVIAAAKITGDRRLRATVLSETINRTREFIARGDFDRADNELDAALRVQPALTTPLGRVFADYRPILPRFRAAVAQSSSEQSE